MWTRASLKDRGRAAFTANYWKAVLIAVILTLVTGGSLVNLEFRSNGNPISTIKSFFNIPDTSHHGSEIINEMDGMTIDDLSDILDLDEEDTQQLENMLGDQSLQSELQSLFEDYKEWIGGVILVIVLIAMVAASFGICVKAFVLNPLEVGGRDFFLQNLEAPADLGLIGNGFKYNYLRTVKTMFFRDLYCFLWSLLLIVPGIIKAYEYRMVPYIIAENPELSTKEVLLRSKEMMEGSKFEAFVLDLSFIGWGLLSAITLGIVGIFYVRPYEFSTMAALYDTLRGTTVKPVSGEYYIEVE